MSVETERMAALVGEGGGVASKEVRRSLRRASGSLARLADMYAAESDAGLLP